MVYITGDLHGDIERTNGVEFERMRRGDTVIVCGDFGFVWDGSERERKQIERLGRRPYNLLFVEGTHDNHPLLMDYPVEIYAGAPARKLSGNCYQLLRGEVYNIEGKSIFAMGGGASDDRELRVEGESWWPEELPSSLELGTALTNLAGYDNHVDYIVTHSASVSMHRLITGNAAPLDSLSTFLESVLQTINYKRWFFGRYHLDRQIPPTHRAIFRDLVALD